MRASEAEILSGIRKVQADLSPALPPELTMTAQDLAAVRIRLQVLRARLEFPPEKEKTPLPLTGLLAVLTELVGYAVHTNQAFSKTDEALGTLLLSIRTVLLTADPRSLRDALDEQSNAFKDRVE